jgi:hypothetical protein
MTVSSPVSKIVHVTHEAVTDYTFLFKVFKAGELAVALVDAFFRVIPLELGADYTVAGLGLDQGGSVTLSSAGRDKAGTGLDLVILRRMDFTQETDYRPHDIFPAETHERALDILTMICQELREQVGRAMIAPPNLDRPIQYSDLVEWRDAAEAAQGKAQAAKTQARGAAALAKINAALARKWAANPEDEEVREGLFSALHYAAKAAQSVESLDLPDLNTAEAGQVLMTVRQADQSLKLEYADIFKPITRAEWEALPDSKFSDGIWYAIISPVCVRGDRLIMIMHNGKEYMLGDGPALVPGYYTEFRMFYEQAPFPGWAVCNGAVLVNADVDYAGLWAALLRPENAWKCITKPQWQALSAIAGGVGGVPKFVIDTEAKTVRLPDTRGDATLGAGGGLDVGDWQPDQMRPITGTMQLRTTPGSSTNSSGALYNSAPMDPLPWGPSGKTAGFGGIDSALLGINYNGATTHPRSFALLPCVYIGGQ